MKLGSRNLHFWTSAKILTLITKTPGVLLLREGTSFIDRVKSDYTLYMYIIHVYKLNIHCPSQLRIGFQWPASDRLRTKFVQGLNRSEKHMIPVVPLPLSLTDHLTLRRSPGPDTITGVVIGYGIWPHLFVVQLVLKVWDCGGALIEEPHAHGIKSPNIFTMTQ